MVPGRRCSPPSPRESERWNSGTTETGVRLPAVSHGSGPLADGCETSGAARAPRCTVDSASANYRSRLTALPSIEVTMTFLALCDRYGSDDEVVVVVACARVSGSVGRPSRRHWSQPCSPRSFRATQSVRSCRSSSA